MTTHYSDPQHEWVTQAIKICIDAERQLSQYHSELTKDVEECLRLARLLFKENKQRQKK